MTEVGIAQGVGGHRLRFPVRLLVLGNTSAWKVTCRRTRAASTAEGVHLLRPAGGIARDYPLTIVPVTE